MTELVYVTPFPGTDVIQMPADDLADARCGFGVKWHAKSRRTFWPSEVFTDPISAVMAAKRERERLIAEAREKITELEKPIVITESKE